MKNNKKGKSSRSYLSKGTIELFELNKVGNDWIVLNEPTTFYIEEIEKENNKKAIGASAVCYQARRNVGDQSGYRGRLKEVYPQDLDLSRIHSLLVANANNAYQTFKEECEHTRDTYSHILEKRNDNQGEVLNNFIPKFQFYVGKIKQSELYQNNMYSDVDEENNVITGMYIWYENDYFGITYQNYIENCHKKNNKYYLRDLSNIVKVIHTLTERVATLHKLGYVHMDIKPSNFLVAYIDKSNNVINPNQISLFDFDSLQIKGSLMEGKTIRYSEDYLSSSYFEQNKVIDVSADFYAIAQTLAYSFLNETLKYEIDMFNRNASIKKALMNSLLLRKSGIIDDYKNNKPSDKTKFMQLLIEIIEKCMDPQQHYRYQYIDHLLNDLRQLTILAEKIYQDKIVLEYSSEKSDDAKAIIQAMLFNYPIYNYMNESRFIDYVLVGFGNYCQTFIKVAMELSQMIYPHIRDEYTYCIPRFRIFSKDQKDFYTFLDENPSIRDFVMVNGKTPNKVDRSDILAVIDFIEINEINYENINKVINDIKVTIEKDRREIHESENDFDLAFPFEPNIYFTSLGNNKINQDVITMMEKKLANKEKSNQIFYFSKEVNHEDRSRYKVIKPIYFGYHLTSEDDELMNKLKRMGFNAHLIWDKKIIRSIHDEYESFIKDEYSFASSLANALGIKYKLHSIGIDSVDLDQAALEFESKINVNEMDSNEQAKRKNYIFRRLVACEHRRWLVEKICCGWHDLRNADGEIEFDIGYHQDKKAKRHICLERSSADIILSDLDGKPILEKWKKLKTNDQLDMISFKYREAAIKRLNSCGVIDFSLIDDQMYEASDDLRRMHQQYMYCVNHLKHMGVSYAYLYPIYYDNFKKAIEASDASNKELLLVALKRIDEQVKVFVDVNKYEDFKANDIKLIRQIPFILTYRHDLKYATSLMIDHKNDIFANVATLSWLQPMQATYYYELNGNNAKELKLTSIMNALKGMSAYLKERKIKSKVNVELLLTNVHVLPLVCDEFASLKKDECNFDIRLTLFDPKCDLEALNMDLKGLKVEVNHDEMIYQAVCNQLKDQVYYQMRNDTISKFVKYLDFKQEIKMFEYDSENDRLLSGESFLRFIPNKAYLRVFDAYRISNAYEIKVQPPEHYYEYEMLWNLYQSHKGAYKRLCEKLKIGSSKVDRNYQFDTTKLEKQTLKNYTIILPNFTHLSVKYILNQMKMYDFIQSFEILFNQQSTYKVNIVHYDDTNGKIKVNNFLDHIFKDIYLLANSEDVKVEVVERMFKVLIETTRGCIEGASIAFDVSKGIHCNLQDVITDKDELYVFEQLFEQNILIDRRIEAGFVVEQGVMKQKSVIYFDYISKEMKHILNKSGLILEYYIYYKVKELDYFDDIVSSEVLWTDYKLKNEFDAVLTKGNRMMFVECKLTSNSAEYYHKLKALMDQLGVNCCGVVVVDDNSKESYEQRGLYFDIHTVNSSDLNNIDIKLMEIMEKERMK